MILFLDLLAVMFIVTLGFIGYKRGLVEELGRLIGIIIAMSFAWRYYVEISGFLLNTYEINPWVVMVFSFTIIFVIILIIIRLLTKFIHLLLLSKSTKLLNRIMGFAFGAIKASWIIMIFIWALDISPKNNWSQIIHEQSAIASSMTSIRMKIIQTFHLKDPVENGEKFIQDIMKNVEEEK